MLAIIAVLCILFCCYNNAHAFSIVADISPNNVEISSKFNGKQVLIFGSIIQDSDNLLIIVRGPKKNMLIRKKEKVFGIWVNGQKRIFQDVPQFYSIACSAKTKEIDNFLKNELTNETKNSESLLAFEKYQKKAKLYQDDNVIEIIHNSLFRSNIDLPSNIARGKYSLEVIAFNNGKIVGITIIPLLVNKVGLDAWLFDMHYLHPLYYGIGSILLAITMGWMGNLLPKK